MRRFLGVAALSSAIWAAPVHAYDGAAASAELVLWPANTSFITQVTDDVLSRLGCPYDIDDPHVANELMQLALAARRAEREPEGRPDRFEHANRLVHRSVEGVRTVIEFDRPYTNAPAIKETWNGRPIWLDSRLHIQVRDIVRRMAAAQKNRALLEACSRI